LATKKAGLSAFATLTRIDLTDVPNHYEARMQTIPGLKMIQQPEKITHSLGLMNRAHRLALDYMLAWL
jgi:hypothetical protein